MLDFNAAGYLLKPVGGLFDLDSPHAQLEQRLDGDCAATVGHGYNHAMDALFFGQANQIGGDFLEAEFPFNISGPAHNFNAQPRPAQTFDQPEGSIPRAEDVHSFAKEWQAYQPRICRPPAK